MSKFFIKFSYNGESWMTGYCTSFRETADEIVFEEWCYPVVESGAVGQSECTQRKFPKQSVSYLIFPIPKPNWQ